MNVVALAAITVDGKIARSEDELVNWTSAEDKKFFAQTTREAGVIVLGRRTYATFPSPLKDRLHIVLTSDPSKYANLPGQVEFTNGKPAKIIDMLSTRGFSTVVIAGGASVYTQFMQAKLVNELWLTIEPKVFGKGVDLFADVVETDLLLVESTQLAPDVLLVKYKVK